MIKYTSSLFDECFPSHVKVRLPTESIDKESILLGRFHQFPVLYHVSGDSTKVGKHEPHSDSSDETSSDRLESQVSSNRRSWRSEFPSNRIVDRRNSIPQELARVHTTWKEY